MPIRNSGQDQVESFFRENPNKKKYSRKESYLPFSYFADDTTGQIYRLDNELSKNHCVGRGGFGRVKGIFDTSSYILNKNSSQLTKSCWLEIGNMENDKKNSIFKDDENGLIPLVVKIQKIKNEKDLALAKIEADVNLDFGVASGGLTVIEAKKEKPYMYKVYQPMYYLGKSLKEKLTEHREPRTHEEELIALKAEVNKAIELCILIYKVHAGKATKTKRPFALKDLKPDNVLVDDDGGLHLIDFGLASTELKASCILPCYLGNFSYGPIPLRFLVDTKTATKVLGTLPNYLTNEFQDKIALLRVIAHPRDFVVDSQCQSRSIFSKSTYNLLPSCLKTLIDTQDVAPHYQANRIDETVKFYTAVFLLFVKNNYDITDQQIAEIKLNEDQQEILIAEALQLEPVASYFFGGDDNNDVSPTATLKQSTRLQSGTGGLTLCTIPQ